MPLPTSLTKVTVKGRYVDTVGNPLTGTVTFVPSHVLQSGDEDFVIVPRPRVATLDASGAFSIELHATNDPDLTPGGIFYQVTERFDGLDGRTFEMALPHDQETVDMADVIPVKVGRSPSPAFTLLRISAMHDVDVAAREDGFVLVWDAETSTHVYAAAPTGAGGGGAATPPINVELPDSTVQYLLVAIPNDGSDPETWPDRLAFQFGGSPTGRFNKYGELRSQAAREQNVAFAASGRSPTQTADVVQALKSDGTVLMGVGYNQAVYNVPIAAPNVGVKVTATLVGAPEPENPQVGDLWVRY